MKMNNSNGKNRSRLKQGSKPSLRGIDKKYSPKKNIRTKQSSEFGVGKISEKNLLGKSNNFATRGKTTKSQQAGRLGTRLNKVIAESGVSSRRAADELILQGRVRVNSQVVQELGSRVFPEDRIMVDDRLITKPERHVYFILNKPKNTITTTKDEKERKTVLDLVRVRERIYPIGRLDRNTTGVLILTNDGEFANRMMHPKYQVKRIYKVALDKPLDFKHAKEISSGIELENGVFTQACELFINDKERQSITIILTEGKNREVRRMFEAFNYDVIKLDRIEYGGISKRGIRRGEFRTLTREEINFLKKNLGMQY